MAATSFLGGLGKGLMDFAGSGLDQTAIGAGLGYGLDRLAGGEGGTGAILGGAGGLLNYGSGAGGFGDNLFGEGASNFDATAVGGLFGQQGQQSPQGLVQGAGGSLVPYDTAVAQGLTPEVPQSATGGLLDRASDFYSQNKDAIGGFGDLATAYGKYQEGQSQRDLAQSEIDYRNRIAGLNQQTFDRDFANQEATNQAAIDAFNKSKLRNYYSA